MTKAIVPQINPDQLPLIPEDDLSQSPFERIKYIDAIGEYWLARELQPLLEYAQWRNLMRAVKDAQKSCEASGYDTGRHFAEVSKPISLGDGIQKSVLDFRLTRYACYLIVMNGDPSKPVIAEGQTYFAVQTRRQELADEKKRLKTAQDVTAYQMQGKSEDWARARVEAKASQKGFNATLYQTHETHEPNYAEIGSIQTRGLFDMTKAEIIDHLGLLPKDADKYRDHLSIYAQDALKQVSRTCELRMKSLKRELTSDEQAQIVRDVVAIVAPTMHKLAEYVQIDFVSGAELDANGRALIIRNVKLLKG